jgi:hypothetical protein
VFRTYKELFKFNNMKNTLISCGVDLKTTIVHEKAWRKFKFILLKERRQNEFLHII